MSHLHLFVLGPPRLVAADQPVDLSLRKAAALLVYLAVTAQPHSRDALATMLWPEHGQREARANLRRTLYRLRELAPGAVQEVEPDAIRAAPPGELSLDSALFQQHAAAGLAPARDGDELTAERVEQLSAAAGLYSDDLLAGWSLPDCPAFDEWQFFERERLRGLFARVLDALVEAHEAQGMFAAAIGYARRSLALDALDEALHRRLMGLYARAGQPSAALRQYGECVRLLDAELGVAPDDETTALYEAIRSNRLAARPAAATPPAEQQRRNLPAGATPFVGRETEQADLAQLLAAPGCRLLTVVGPGGIGKTRLALAAAAAAEGFDDGIFFVALAPLASAEPMVDAVADGLGLQLAAASAPQEQLLSFLRPRRLLLVLDNFEHVLDGAGLVAAMLEAAPGLRILATSRERLNLSGETVYRLAGMSFPEHEALRGTLEYGAVQLLMQSARLARPAFEPRDYDLAQMVRICRLVAGMPLALVLAASWVDMLPFREIADEIERSLDFLAGSAVDVPARQRSVRAAIDASWQRLPAPEQQLFARLSVFRGGFTRRAAQDVAGATLPALRTLLNTSFLSVDTAERYAVHELLRQYGAERLRDSSEAQTTQDAHAAYFLRQLRDAADALKGTRQVPALDAITADFDNIVAAWDHAIQRADAAALAEAAQGLCLYHEMRGALPSGEAAFGRAVTALAEAARGGGATDQHNDVRAILLVCQGALRALGGQLHDGQALIEQGLAALGSTGRRHATKAFGLLWLGWTRFLQGNTAQAEQTVQRSLELYASRDDRWGIARNLFILGNSYTARGKLAESEPPLRESLALCQVIGDRRSSVLIQRNLAILHFWRGEYPETGALLEQAALLSRELDDRLGQAYTLREHGKLYVALGAYEPAIDTLERSIAITNDIGSAWESAATLDDLGAALRVSGAYEAADDALKRCLQAAQSRDNRYYIARCLGDLGCLARERGAYAQAEAYLHQALALWTDMGHAPYQAWTLCQLGHALRAAGDNRAAQAYDAYRQALRLATTHAVVPCVLDIFVGAAALLARDGSLDEATRLLLAAQQHPAGAHETRQQAQRLRRSLVSEALATTFAAPAAEEPAAWLALAEQLQALLDTAPSPPSEG